MKLSRGNQGRHKGVETQAVQERPRIASHNAVASGLTRPIMSRKIHCMLRQRTHIEETREDSPPWFGPRWDPILQRKVGVGFQPVTWQGWLITLAYVALGLVELNFGISFPLRLVLIIVTSIAYLWISSRHGGTIL